MLRDDDRRWYGFELRETIERGESLILRMSAAPPLVHFAIGALYNKIGDHKAAVKHLGHIIENSNSDELAYVYPTPELRSYVKVLRKIERDPADAPLTSAAVRSLERARKIRGGVMLEQSRTAFAIAVPKPAQIDGAVNEHEHGKESFSVTNSAESNSGTHANEPEVVPSLVDGKDSNTKHEKEQVAINGEPYSNRKSISEVLHDIYDTSRT
jgi:hypothetical protein